MGDEVLMISGCILFWFVAYIPLGGWLLFILSFKQKQNFARASPVVASVILKGDTPINHNLIIHKSPYIYVNNKNENDMC